MQYVRSLEQRISQLEHEHSNNHNSNSTKTSNDGTIKNSNSNSNSTGSHDLLPGRPEAVVRALQILEVREQLERDRAGNASVSPEEMDDNEKALLREMCNVVWRKLEENPNGPRMDQL